MQLGFWKVLFWLWCKGLWSKRVCSGFQSCEVWYTRHGSRWWRLNGNQVHQWHRPGLPRPVHLHLHHCGHQCGESASSVEFLKSNVQLARTIVLSNAVWIAVARDRQHLETIADLQCQIIWIESLLLHGCDCNENLLDLCSKAWDYWHVPFSGIKCAFCVCRLFHGWATVYQGCST